MFLTMHSGELWGPKNLQPNITLGSMQQRGVHFDKLTPYFQPTMTVNTIMQWFEDCKNICYCSMFVFSSTG